jgi:flagellar hook assembly protein FlgD
MSKIVGELNIQIRNENGELVKTLVDSKIKGGNHDFTWTRTNEKSGIYFVVSQIGNVIKTNKVILK